MFSGSRLYKDPVPQAGISQLRAAPLVQSLNRRVLLDFVRALTDTEALRTFGNPDRAYELFSNRAQRNMALLGAKISAFEPLDLASSSPQNARTAMGGILRSFYEALSLTCTYALAERDTATLRAVAVAADRLVVSADESELTLATIRLAYDTVMVTLKHASDKYQISLPKFPISEEQ